MPFWIVLLLLFSPAFAYASQDIDAYEPPPMFSDSQSPAPVASLDVEILDVKVTDTSPKPPPHAKLAKIGPNTGRDYMRDGFDTREILKPMAGPAPMPEAQPEIVSVEEPQETPKAAIVAVAFIPPLPPRRPEKLSVSRSYVEQLLAAGSSSAPLSSLSPAKKESKVTSTLTLEDKLATPTAQDILDLLEH